MKKMLVALMLVATPALAGEEMDAAVNMMALGSVVSESCTGLSVDMKKFVETVEGLGVAVSDVANNPKRMAQGARVIGVLRADLGLTCRLASERFGEDGTVVPGVFIKTLR